MDLLVARNPDPDSSLPYLVRLPLGKGLVFRAKETWPRTKAIYCHPVGLEEWPAEPEIVERVALKACARRGAAIDVVADRGREQRSQIVYTRARGRQMVFWQSPRTRKQARPDVRLPTARAAGIPDLEILVDAHERYPYSFPNQQTSLTTRALVCGDYAVLGADGRVVAAVERKGLSDLVSSVSDGRLRFALTELVTLPRAAVVVEERYSAIFKQEFVRPARIADGLAELQVRWPSVPIVFCDTRALAEEWTYRFLAAARTWAETETVAARLIGGSSELAEAPQAPAPSTAEVRRWARENGIPVPDKGRLRPEVHQAWRAAHLTG
ncbi:ERCC4 domain-containing protein [Pseudonocardia pini]|uniref:ERCC4 domain-containing protein n=1 Tax=Pseudonocardia pini TaxID=2758030 RepID=UPI0028AA12AD|nr:ERCC4 domain-containing protein [Pseudonocardia pini]